MEKKAEFDDLVFELQQDLGKEGRAVVKITCSHSTNGNGINVKRNYWYKNRIFSEGCHYDSREEFEDEEPHIAIKNLEKAFPLYFFKSREEFVEIYHVSQVKSVHPLVIAKS